MLRIIGQPLLAYLYLLLTTSPRLAGALALFVLVFLGAVIIRGFSHTTRRRRQEGYNNMALPDGFSDSPHLAGGSRQVKTSSPSSTTAAIGPYPTFPAPPITPVLAPVTRTSSSTSSSDLLLPLPTNINRRSSSWPPVAPIPWRSSWGFLDEDQVVALDEEDGEEEDTPTEQGHEQGQGQFREPPQHQHEVIVIPSSTDTDGKKNNFLALPTPGASASASASRRTGSMEARKGSACTISGLEDIHGLQRLELGIPVPTRENADADAGSPADLVGVGGQFQL